MALKPRDNLIPAVAFALLNAAMVSGQNLFAKLLAAHFGPIEVVFFRSAGALVLLGFWIVAMRQYWRLKTRRPWAHVFRSAIGAAGIVLGMWALSMLTIAETTVLLFTSPLFTLLLSRMFLGERFGVFRLAAVILGFAGVAMMAGPGGAMPWLGLMAGLGWGLASGAVDTTLRWLGSTENAYATVFYLMLFCVLATGLYWPFAATPITDMAWGSFAVIAGLGLCGVVSQLAKAQSFRLGEASVIAPIMYTMLIWAVLFDYLFWNAIPDWNVVCGGVVIIISNLIILRRQHRRERRAERPEPA